MTGKNQSQEAIASIQRVEETQQKLDQLAVNFTQMTTLVEKIAQAATEHEKPLSRQTSQFWRWQVSLDKFPSSWSSSANLSRS